jgi:RsmE family RNA methyltransferase
MNLIILTEGDRDGEVRFRLTGHRATHIREVLRAAAEETVEVGMLNGPSGTALIKEVTPAEILLEVTEWREVPGLAYEVDLICAIPRPKTLKKVLTVSAMMGVRKVHFVRANRTDKSYVASSLLHEPDCLPYLFDGLSQGKFTRLPEILVHPLFRPFVEDQLSSLYSSDDERVKLLCDSSASATLNRVLSIGSPRKYVVVIGPEGGWVPFEIDLLKRAGFLPFSLGPWTLRVETAISAALAQLELAIRTRRD